MAATVRRPRGRARADESILRTLGATIQGIDPAIALFAPLTMQARIEASPSAYLHRSSAWLVGSYALVALALGVIGLYGVVAYSVSQRTREVGVRMALGAEPKVVYRLILSEAVRLAGVGTLLGVLCSVAAATLMRRLLFGVQPWDVPTLAAVAAISIASALLASHVPASHAASVNPLDALRAE